MCILSLLEEKTIVLRFFYVTVAPRSKTNNPFSEKLWVQSNSEWSLETEKNLFLDFGICKLELTQAPLYIVSHSDLPVFLKGM